MKPDDVVCDKLLRDYPLFIVGKDWWDMGFIHHKYRELGNYPIKMHLMNKQVLCSCHGVDLYLNIDSIGGEAYCGDRPISRHVLHTLLDYNITIHHDTLDIDALIRQWQIKQIIQ